MFVLKLRDDFTGKKRTYETDDYAPGSDPMDVAEHFAESMPGSWTVLDAYESDDEDDHYCPSSTAGDYGPGNPWDAPGMSIHDFI